MALNAQNRAKCPVLRLEPVTTPAGNQGKWEGWNLMCHTRHANKSVQTTNLDCPSLAVTDQLGLNPFLRNVTFRCHADSGKPGTKPCLGATKLILLINYTSFFGKHFLKQNEKKTKPPPT